jgi:hypothetical protein
MPKTESDFMREAKAALIAASSEQIVAELESQGFPLYISYAFLHTAAETNSVILSRVPGGVGSDLIEEGYDLKGFHIKAKSCNWGPMAGFICQLPIFNKQGVSKINYNTKEIGHYLHCLHNFNGAKTEITRLEAARKTEIGAISKDLPPDAQKAKLKEINKKYDGLVLAQLTLARTAEQISGSWSGENNLAGSPFLPLRREFADLTAVTQMRGVKAAIRLPGDCFYGIAQNVTDEVDEGNNNPTVKIEFLLKRIGTTNFYEVYHGRIFYTKKDDTAKFRNEFLGVKMTDQLEKEVNETYKDYLDGIFGFSEESHNATEDELKAIDSIPSSLAFPRVAAIKFHKINGIMNPFPPFSTEAEKYKNAVSGDYDLFAIWPDMDLHQDELIRQSEITIGGDNRLGGKIFTTHFGYKNNFAIEYVPGFAELAPNGGVMKESAEFGNMNNLGHLVSGILNSAAASTINELNTNIVSGANKGFHSDEGGRPGIMEIEFPIAVYLPKKMASQALNNINNPAGLIQSPGARTRINTYCGLIKSAEDLVVFIKECMEANFRVYVHYRWMIHLLYNTIDLANYNTTLTPLLTKNDATIKKYNNKYVTDHADNLKEFIAINDNRRVINAKMASDQPTYVSNVKSLVTDPADNSTFFEQLRDLMLVYAFTPDMRSFERRREVEELMNRVKITKQQQR